MYNLKYTYMTRVNLYALFIIYLYMIIERIL